MNRSNLSVIAVVMMILLVSSSLYAQIERKNCLKGEHHEYMVEKLQLTEEQQAAIEQLRLDHQKDMIDLRAELQRRKLELESLKRKGSYTRDEFVSKIMAMSQIKEEMALSRANHRMDVYEKLTVEQKHIFDKFGKRMDDRRKHHRGRRFDRDF